VGERHQFVVIPNDLDFSAILPASAGAAPSVIRIRTQDLLSDNAVSIVADALASHREDIEQAALLSPGDRGALRRSVAGRGCGSRAADE
jgi:predicted nuclease of predicted toxin-antitoxin system